VSPPDPLSLSAEVSLAVTAVFVTEQDLNGRPTVRPNEAV
jgi:hypothetical protein